MNFLDDGEGKPQEDNSIMGLENRIHGKNGQIKGFRIKDKRKPQTRCISADWKDIHMSGSLMLSYDSHMTKEAGEM